MDVSLIAAITIDGYIAKDSKHRSTTWTSPEDLHHYVSKIKTADVIIVGSTTFNTFKKHPKNSTWVIYTSKPNDFINPNPSVITTIPTNKPPHQLLEELSAKGYSSAIVAGGASIYTQWMKSGLVNTLHLTVEPYLFGNGVKLFDHDLGQTQLQLVKQELLNSSTLALEYRLSR
jgi:dihydrofolate reductase